MGLRRTPLIDLPGTEDVAALAREVVENLLVIIDVDNTVAPHRVSETEIRHRAAEAVAAFEDVANGTRVRVVTNGAVRGIPEAVGRANKPFTSRRRLGVEPGTTVWVVGDQIMTDGFLAWRLRAPYYHVPITTHAEPVGPSLLRGAGRLVRWLFFRETAAGTSVA